MSAFPLKADMDQHGRDVRFVPNADILRCGKNAAIRSARRPVPGDQPPCCNFVEFSLPRSEPNTARPLVRFAAAQFFKRVQRPTGLAPKGRFISTEAIEREIG